jgi:hypothetical protein
MNGRSVTPSVNGHPPTRASVDRIDLPMEARSFSRRVEASESWDRSAVSFNVMIVGRVL